MLDDMAVASPLDATTTVNATVAPAASSRRRALSVTLVTASAVGAALSEVAMADEKAACALAVKVAALSPASVADEDTLYDGASAETGAGGGEGGGGLGGGGLGGGGGGGGLGGVGLGGGGLGGGGVGGGGGGEYALKTPVLLPGVQPLRSSARGTALVSPASKLAGTAAVPLSSSWKASYDVTTVPLGAPSSVRKPGMPSPAHGTLSSA
jgi:hypothetical protein